MFSIVRVTTKTEFTRNATRAVTTKGVNDGNARLALLCVAQFVVVLDVTIVAIALPAIGDDLGVSATDLQWVLSAYTLTFGGLLMLAGRAADLYGRRRAFRAGLLLFAAASLGCALAPTAAALVALRARSRARARRWSRRPRWRCWWRPRRGRRRARARSPSGRPPRRAAARPGWVLGGAISGGLGWEWVFAVNVPIGLAGAALAGRLLPESREPGAARLDVLGRADADRSASARSCSGSAAARPTGLAAVATLGPLAAGLALLALFAAIERRAPAPLLPPGALRAPGLARAVVRGARDHRLDDPGDVPVRAARPARGRPRPGRGGPAVRAHEPRRHRGLARRAARHRPHRRAARDGAAASASSPPAAALARRQRRRHEPRAARPFVLIGGGLGVASVASTAAGTAADADRPGLASGLLNTAAQLGSALGLALLVAPAAAAGFAWGWAGAAAVAVAAALAIAFVRRPVATAHPRRSPG